MLEITIVILSVTCLVLSGALLSQLNLPEQQEKTEDKQKTEKKDPISD